MVAPTAFPGTTELAQQFVVPPGSQFAGHAAITVADKAAIALPPGSLVALMLKLTCPVAVAMSVPVAVQLAPGASDDVHVLAENVIEPSVNPTASRDGIPAVWPVLLVTTIFVSRLSFACRVNVDGDVLTIKTPDAGASD